VAGALELAACYRYFPVGTVFLVVVDPGVGSSRRGIAAEQIGKCDAGAAVDFNPIVHPAWLGPRILGEAGLRFVIVEALTGFAAERSHSLLELAFGWLLTKPVVASVIAGATRVEQIEQNVKAIEWQLSAGDMAEIDRITKG
jgi:hypothetical protein